FAEAIRFVESGCRLPDLVLPVCSRSLSATKLQEMQFSTLVTHPFQLRRPDSALSERSDDRTVVPCKNARCSPGVGQRDLSHSIADVSRLERPRRRSNQYCACRANGCMASAGFYWALGNVIPKR